MFHGIKYPIVSLVFSHLGFWSGNLFLIAPFPDLCRLVPFSFFNEQFNLESENRFDLLAKGHETKSTETLTSKTSFISGLKFSSININSIRGKKLELLAFIDFHQSQILAIQETKIDNSILTSELFPESFPYSVYRKDRMVVVLCFLSTRTSHTCPSQNWTMTQSQFGSNFL